MAAGSIVVELIARTGSFQTDTARAEKALNKLRREAASSATAFKNTGVAGGAGIGGITSALNLATNAARGFGAAAVAGISVGAVVRAADEYTKFTAQLRLATKSQVEFNTAFSNVQAIANQAQTSISSVTVLYARLNNAFQGTEKTQQDLANITETISLALKVNGATAAESASAILQLSQAFGSGVLRGEEFNAVNEAAPALLRRVADEMGVEFGALRELASQGKITSDILGRAFNNSEYLKGLRANVQETRTVTGALTELRNNLTVAVGTFDNATGASKLLSAAISGVAGAFSALSKLAQGKSLSSIFGDIESTLPGLKAYNEQLNKAKTAADELAKSNKVSILPQGAGMGEFIRKDIGDIKDAQAQQKKLNAEVAKFKTENPFKDKTADAEKYNQKVKELQNLEARGLISTQESARYQAQFKEDILGKTKKVKDATVKENEAAQELADTYKDLLDSANALSQPRESKESEKLQAQLDAITKVDAATKDYVETIIAQVRAKEELAAYDEQDTFNREFDDTVLKQIEEESEAAATAAEAFKDRSYKAWMDALPAAEQLELQIAEVRMEVEKLGLAPEFADPIIQGLITSSEEAKKTSDDFKDLERAIDGFSKNAATAVADLAFGIKGSFGDAITSILKDLARLAIQKSIFDPLVKGFTNSASSGTGFAGFFSGLFGGGRASGGSVDPSRSYLVGERGVERFVPNTAGTIIPNSAMGGGNTNVTVNVDAGGSSVDGNGGVQLGQMIGAAVQSILIKEKRAGGLLA